MALPVPPPPENDRDLDEFPDHETQDAVPDPISQALENDVAAVHLTFKWTEWGDGKDVIDPMPLNMAPEGLEFRMSFNKKDAFANVLKWLLGSTVNLCIVFYQT